MARARLYHVVQDALGNVLANKTVTVFEVDGSTPFANDIFHAVSGGAAQIAHATDSQGLLDLYVDEANARRCMLTISGVSGQVMSEFYPDSGEIVTRDKTQTLTNKTLTAPTITSPAFSDPTVTGGTFDTPAITTPTIDGTPLFNLTGNTMDFQEDGVAVARMWGDSGQIGGVAGTWSFRVPITIRDDGAGGIHDQTASGYMLMVQRNISTKQSCTLVPISAYTQATTGDNSALTAKMFQDGGGANVNATVRAVDFESFLHSDAGANLAVPVVGMELGIHPGWRFPFRQGATVDDWDYTIIGGAANESPTAKAFINMFSATQDWRSDLGLDATEIIYRHGTGLLIHGQSGFDQHILIRNENGQDMFEHTGDGRLRQRPSAFASVIYQDAVVAYFNRSQNASQTAVTGVNTVELPVGGGQRLYIGHRSPFHSIYVEMGSTVNSYVGTGTISIQFWNGSGWANLATAQPANGSVLTDGTSAVSGGGGTGAFVQSGVITFAPPTTWKFDSPTEAEDALVTESMYWIRIAVAAASSTNGVANVIRPGTLNSAEFYAGNLDTGPALAVSGSGRVTIARSLAVGSSTSLLGFYGATAVVRPAAFTQTYATATATHAAPTAATVTNAFGSQDGTYQDTSGTSAAIANNFQECATKINQLVADLANTKQVLNTVIDYGQTLGLFQ